MWEDISVLSKTSRCCQSNDWCKEIGTISSYELLQNVLWLSSAVHCCYGCFGLDSYSGILSEPIREEGDYCPWMTFYWNWYNDMKLNYLIAHFYWHISLLTALSEPYFNMIFQSNMRGKQQVDYCSIEFQSESRSKRGRWSGISRTQKQTSRLGCKNIDFIILLK